MTRRWLISVFRRWIARLKVRETLFERRVQSLLTTWCGLQGRSCSSLDGNIANGISANTLARQRVAMKDTTATRHPHDGTNVPRYSPCVDDRRISIRRFDTIPSGRHSINNAVAWNKRGKYIHVVLTDLAAPNKSLCVFSLIRPRGWSLFLVPVRDKRWAARAEEV